eukprot:scaffold114322_cov48-Phaeocystis_antarctica.AAC.1
MSESPGQGPLVTPRGNSTVLDLQLTVGAGLVQRRPLELLLAVHPPPARKLAAAVRDEVVQLVHL